MDKLSYISGASRSFFHGRRVVLIFQLPGWGVMVLDHIISSTKLAFCKWYPSTKQWIHLELKPISVLKWGLSVLRGICVIPAYLIMALRSSKRENDMMPVQRLSVLCLIWMHWLLRFCVSEQQSARWENKGLRKFDREGQIDRSRSFSSVLAYHAVMNVCHLSLHLY